MYADMKWHSDRVRHKPIPVFKNMHLMYVKPVKNGPVKLNQPSAVARCVQLQGKQREPGNQASVKQPSSCWNCCVWQRMLSSSCWAFPPSMSFAPAVAQSDEWPGLIIHCIFVTLIMCLRNWMSLVVLNYKEY